MATEGSPEISLEAVVFGGGAAGLWLLDTLSRRGIRALLLEAGDLGSGQTIASQGIIHGGLKYTLSGLFTSSAKSIREMPMIWRRCLAGEATDTEDGPNLSNTRLRAEYCHIWRTESIRSRVAMIGARAGLRVAPVALDREQRPAILADCPGTVARLDEQAIEPGSFLQDLADQHRARLLKINVESGLEFTISRSGRIELVRLINPDSGTPLNLRADLVIFVAGVGNAILREMTGLSTRPMQRRPLHMVMARSRDGGTSDEALPTLNGHCVDGATTRLTITTTRDNADRIVWQIGGRVSEVGVEMDRESLVAHTQEELVAALPGMTADALARWNWSTYRVDRAEGRGGAGGSRPDDVSVLEEGNVITGWPTKLALAPRLAQLIVDRVLKRRDTSADLSSELLTDATSSWPRPVVALPPWELESSWTES